MRHPLRLTTALLLAPAFVVALASGAVAQVVQPLPQPLAPTNPTTIQLRATGAAFAGAPPANQARAQFAYRDALARYRAGDLAGARASAAYAQSLLGAPPVASPPGSAVPPAGWFGGTGVRSPIDPGPGANAPLVRRDLLGAGIAGSPVRVDEDELVARSRSAVANCAANTPDRLSEARREFGAVWAAHEANDIVRERLAARTLVERCGVLF